MKTTTLTFLIVLFAYLTSFSQNWTHARLEPNYSDVNSVKGAAVDENGNLYMAGDFGNCYHCSGPNGLYINKFDSNGDLVWSDTIHTVWGSITGLFITPQNRLCIVGRSSNGSIDFFGYTLSGNYPYAIGFMAEFDLNGNCLNASALAFAPCAIKLNPDSSLSIAGESRVPFFGYSSATGYFVGNFVDFSNANWIEDVSLPSPWSSFDPIIESDGSGNIYLTNVFGHDVVMYNPTGPTFVCNTNSPAIHCIEGNLYHATAMYLEKFSSDGTLIWQKDFIPWSIPNDMVTYKGNILVTGFFKDSIQYGSLKYKADSLGFNHLYVLEVDTNGNEIKLLIAPHVNSSCWYSQIRTCQVITHGLDVYITGEMEGAAAFGSDTLMAACADPRYVFHAMISTPLDIISNLGQTDKIVDVYPNPSDGVFNIQLGNWRDSEICVYDVLGNFVMQKDSQVCDRIDLSERAHGMYFVEVVFEGKRIVEKIVLQ